MTTQKINERNSNDNCFLICTDDLEGGGYLTCSYNHKIGEECLMNKKLEYLKTLEKQ